MGILGETQIKGMRNRAAFRDIILQHTVLIHDGMETHAVFLRVLSSRRCNCDQLFLFCFCYQSDERQRGKSTMMSLLSLFV